MIQAWRCCLRYSLGGKPIQVLNARVKLVALLKPSIEGQSTVVPADLRRSVEGLVLPGIDYLEAVDPQEVARVAGGDLHSVR